MEEYEKDYILKNLSDLTSNTLCNCQTLIILVEKGVITNEEYQFLSAKNLSLGSMAATMELYQIALTRLNGYNLLIDALYKSGQTGALSVLLDAPFGVNPPAQMRKAQAELLQDFEVDILDNKFSFREIFPNLSTEELMEILHDGNANNEFRKIQRKTEKLFKLQTYTPLLRPFYIQRSISNRLLLRKELFKCTRKEVKDVFVFTGIGWRDLKELIKPHRLQSSTSQRWSITCRHIYLAHDDDWNDILQAANTPVHLINFDGGNYFLQRSNRTTNIVLDYSFRGDEKQHPYLTEDVIIHQISTERSCMLLCDLPGMGKTWLMESMAKKIQGISADRIVFFIPLPILAQHLEEKQWNKYCNNNLAMIFECACTSKLATSLLCVSGNKNNPMMFVCDGFDEIMESSVEKTTSFLKALRCTPNVKLLISSRPHLRNHLETSFELASFDILPLCRKEQISFLCQHWQGKLEAEEQNVPLEQLASQCLASPPVLKGDPISKLLGTPLICSLLAVINEENAQRLSALRRDRPPAVPDNILVNSISELYQMFVKFCLKNLPKDQQEHVFDRHINYALLMLFPDVAAAYIRGKQLITSDVNLIKILFSNDEERIAFVTGKTPLKTYSTLLCFAAKYGSPVAVNLLFSLHNNSQRNWLASGIIYMNSILKYILINEGIFGVVNAANLSPLEIHHPTEVYSRLQSTLKSNLTQAKLVTLVKNTSFFMHWIELEEQSEPADYKKQGIHIWDYVAQCVIDRISQKRLNGTMLRRYSCRETNAQTAFIVELFLIKEHKKWSVVEPILSITDGWIRFMNQLDDDISQHPLTSPFENITIIVGDTFSNRNFISSHTVFLISDEIYVEPIETKLKKFASIETNPLGWREQKQEILEILAGNGEVILGSRKVEVTDFLEYLSGAELQQFLRNRSLTICNRKSSTLNNDHYVPRWLKLSQEFNYHPNEDVIYLVFNATRGDNPKISEKFQSPTYFAKHMHDLMYFQGRVAVTKSLDYTSTSEYLRSLDHFTIKKTSTSIQLLHFDSGKLYKVASELELLLLEDKVLVIKGRHLQGKSSLMRQLYFSSSAPVCFISAQELVGSFQPSVANIEESSILNVLLNKLQLSKFERAVLERNLGSLELVVIIDDANMTKCEHILHNVIDVLLNIEYVRIVLSSKTSREKDFVPNCKHVVAELLELSSTEIIDLLTGGPPNDTLHIHAKLDQNIAKTIFIEYERKFCTFPPLIWIAVGQLYGEKLSDIHSNSGHSCLDLNIKISEIYDKFFTLQFRAMDDKPRGHPSRLNQYQLMQILHVMKKVFPELQRSFKFVFDDDESINTYDLCSHYEDFTEYFVGLFAIGVLTGNIERISSNSAQHPLEVSFWDFFINHYMNSDPSSSSKLVLNDLLGYHELMKHSEDSNRIVQFPIDVRRFNLYDVLLLSENCPNITRILFESFVLEPVQPNMAEWIESHPLEKIDIAKLLRFLCFSNPHFSRTEILTICSVRLGFFQLFKFLITNEKELIHMTHIPIRDCQSFRTLLHLLMYFSKDDDRVTVQQKKLIINILLQEDPTMFNTRNYYGDTPILEPNTHFELVKYLKQMGASIEDTNFVRNNLLDKNSENPGLFNRLRYAYPNEYDRLSMSSKVRAKLPNMLTPLSLDKYRKTISLKDESDVIEFLKEGGTYIKSTERCMKVAEFVGNWVTSSPGTDESADEILKQIFSETDKEFEHPVLSNILDAVLSNAINPSQIASQNIEILLSKSFFLDWIIKLSHFGQACFLVALERSLTNEVFGNISNKFTSRKYIQWPVIKASMALGSTKWLRWYIENAELTEQVRIEAVNIMLTNSLFDTEEVVELKQDLLKALICNSDGNGSKRNWKGTLMLPRVSYELIRALIDEIGIEVDTKTKEKNALNQCIKNIKNYTKYLGESAYDFDFCHHDQVMYLAEKVGVNERACRDMNEVVTGIKKWISVKTNELRAVGFKIYQRGDFERVDNSDSGFDTSDQESNFGGSTLTDVSNKEALRFGELIRTNFDSLVKATECSFSILAEVGQYFNPETKRELVLEMEEKPRSMKFWNAVRIHIESMSITTLKDTFHRHDQAKVVNILLKMETELRDKQQKDATTDHKHKPSTSHGGSRNLTEQNSPRSIPRRIRNTFSKTDRLPAHFTDPKVIGPERTMEFVDDYYRLPKGFKGLFLLINIVKYNGSKHENRYWTATDVRRLEIVFKALGFDVISVTEPDRAFTRQMFSEIIEHFRARCELLEVSSFAVYVGGHGSDGLIHMSDGSKIHFETDVLAPLCSQHYNFNKELEKSHWDNIPKMFFLQMCRLEMEGYKYEVNKKMPRIMNCLISYSSGPNQPAYRNKELGSFYVTALTDALAQYAGKKDLCAILDMVRERVEQYSILDEMRGSQRPEYIIIGSFGKLYLNMHSLDYTL